MPSSPDSAAAPSAPSDDSTYGLNRRIAACLAAFNITDVEPTDRVGVSVAVLAAAAKMNPMSADAVSCGFALADGFGKVLTMPSTVDIFVEADAIAKQAASAGNAFSALRGFGMQAPPTGERRQVLIDHFARVTQKWLLNFEERGMIHRTPVERDLGV